MIERDNITNANSGNQDDQLDLTLRPQNLGEYVGQEDTKMNVIQRSITTVFETSGLIRDWFTTEFYGLTHPNAPEKKGETDEHQESTHPVWDGSLDEPIWW